MTDQTTQTRLTSDKPVIFSGIKPTGAKTLGNYAGGFSQYLHYQDEGLALYAVVDLHSTTVAYDASALARETLDLAALLYACGLDERSVVFVQSHVPAHAEAARLLATVTSFGDLRRMHQFKEKGAEQEFVSLALFDYPCLMAADILLYDTDLVPIGDDQRQHLELARDVALRFNQRFGETLRVPEGRYPSVAARVMDLQEPLRKMGTTGGSDAGTVRLLDPPDLIRKKIKSAVTDSGREIGYGPGKQGIANLLEILALASGETVAGLIPRYQGVGYGQFKAEVAEAVVALLTPLQERYQQIRSDEDTLRQRLADGAARAQRLSAPKLELMYERMGFLRP
jgi:tryptophanyl-tRNA synthetase